MQNLKENIYKKKANTCTRSAKQSTAKPQGRQGTWSFPVLIAPPDRDTNPPGYSFIPHSPVPHLNSLPGDVYLIFQLNNYSFKIFIWNTQINILDYECWHKYHSTRMTSKNSSCAFLWSCCSSVWHLVLPNWIIDWKSIFIVNGQIHWFSSAPPGNCFYCSVKDQVYAALDFLAQVISTSVKLFGKRAQEWDFIPPFFFLREQRRKLCEENEMLNLTLISEFSCSCIFAQTCQEEAKPH